MKKRYNVLRTCDYSWKQFRRRRIIVTYSLYDSSASLIDSVTKTYDDKSSDTIKQPSLGNVFESNDDAKLWFQLTYNE